MNAVRLAVRTLGVALLVCLVLPFAWTVATGDRFLTVTGESMRPVYEVGDILSVRQPTGAELDTVGQVVVATMPGSTLMYVHRVVETSPDGAWLQGDNNEARDTVRVSQDRVVGTPRFAVRGAAADALTVLTSTPGRVSLAVLATILLLVPVPLRRSRTTQLPEREPGAPAATESASAGSATEGASR